MLVLFVGTMMMGVVCVRELKIVVVWLCKCVVCCWGNCDGTYMCGCANGGAVNACGLNGGCNPIVVNMWYCGDCIDINTVYVCCGLVDLVGQLLLMCMYNMCGSVE